MHEALEKRFVNKVTCDPGRGTGSRTQFTIHENWGGIVKILDGGFGVTERCFPNRGKFWDRLKYYHNFED